MRVAHWFWRPFVLFAGLVTAHVVVVTVVVGRSAAGVASGAWAPLWLVAGATIVIGGLAIWHSLRRIFQPLDALTQYVQSLPAGGEGTALSNYREGELGVVAGAFDRLQRNLSGRLDEIQRTSERLQTVLGNMAEGVLAVGADQAILLANDAGRRLLDFATPDPLGRPLLEVTRARPVHEAVQRASVSDEPIVSEFDAPGSLRRRLSLRATRLPGTPCPGVMIVLHDMTELRRLENMRRELVANVSHELKTPLAAIKGYAETLRLGAINDSEHNVHFVQRIEEEANRLHQLILDILRFARIESGSESFELVEIAVSELVEECVNRFAEIAASKNIRLSIEIADAAASIRADEEGARTIVNNLVDNAIKFTPAGGNIVVRTYSNDSRVTIEVRDTGIGIAEKDQGRIFERFYRADKGRSRDLGGTGLGLAIVKHLVLAFGGTVGVESEMGHGSTFRVEFPRVKVSNVSGLEGRQEIAPTVRSGIDGTQN